MKNNNLTESNDSKQQNQKFQKNVQQIKGSITKVGNTKNDKSSTISAKKGRPVHDDMSQAIYQTI